MRATPIGWIAIAAVAAGTWTACSSDDSSSSHAKGGSGGTAAKDASGDQHASGGTSASGGSGGTSMSGGSGGTSASGGSVADAQADTGGWTLVWSDEFDGTGLPDPAKWDYEEGLVRNNEAQYYTKARVENAHQENGNLVITAIKESYMGASYTSASVITKGHQDFLYGRLEVRAKIPTGKGSWPAIWLLGINIDQVGWPACGEIDIMENVGFDPETIYCTIHTEGTNGHQSKGDQITVTPSPYSDFHLYSMEWSPTEIDLYVDSSLVNAYPNDGQNPWPFTAPQYLLLNLAIGGSWGGQQGIDGAIFPLNYYIDYVRYYQMK